MVEGARLESVYAPKGHRGFESLPLCKYRMVMTKLYFLLLFPLFLVAQNPVEKTVSIIDSLYREDQFYASLSYNLVKNTPSNFAQNGFSSGITFGLLRDMPLNKKRTWAIAAGLGYSYNNLKQNILIEHFEVTHTNRYTYNNDYTNNKLVLHYLELPFELRWRNSTPESHKFWRIYTGFKISYLVGSKSSFQAATYTNTLKNNSDLNKVIVGPYITMGYNTINIYAYYALKPIFKHATVVDEQLKMNSFNLGFQFYIL